MHGISLEDLYLNYDPAAPQQRFRDAGIGAALASGDRLPSPVPWPRTSAPQPVRLARPPRETDPLQRFSGYEALVMTWTTAEATTLATLFTPDHPLSEWYEYRHNVASYVPLVTNHDAPFNSPERDMARYRHSLGLYFPCKIGTTRVLLIKSGLHLDKDGPKMALRRLVTELIDTVKPKVLITTGTGGAIGSDVRLGDVVVAGLTKFHCTRQFKNQPFAHARYRTSPVPAGALKAITPKLLEPNATRIKGGRLVPKIWAGPTAAIVTTDFFAFDDSRDTFKLEGPDNRACDMGDAMVGQIAHGRRGLAWYAIRNASDPQIANPQNNIKQAGDLAGTIYADYGAFTTAASVIATWAVLTHLRL
jgi:nucleoside phosphorylase